MRSPDIQVEGMVIRRPAQGDVGEIPDAEFTPERYNVFVLSDLPADFLTRKQQKLLVDAVKKGAGFMMLGGRSSFGAGGWAGTPIETSSRPPSIPVTASSSPRAESSSCRTRPGSTASSCKSEPTVPRRRRSGTRCRRSWVPTASASGSRWPISSPPSPGPDRRTPDAEHGDGQQPHHRLRRRYLGLGTLISEEGRLAHRKLWRQIIFWLSHKENDSENHVKLTLDRRRVAVGEKLEMSASARDSKGAPIPNVLYETKIEREGPEPISEPVDLYDQGEEAQRLASTPPTRSASRAITRSPRSPAATATKSAVTSPGSSSTRTTASWKTRPPTSNWPAKSPRSPAASR